MGLNGVLNFRERAPANDPHWFLFAGDKQGGVYTMDTWTGNPCKRLEYITSVTMSGSNLSKIKMTTQLNFMALSHMIIFFPIFFNKKFTTFERLERKVELGSGSIY